MIKYNILKRIKTLFQIFFLAITLPFELTRGKKRKNKKLIKTYLVNLLTF